MADSAVINKIFGEYEGLRMKADAERKRRINEVYEKFPRIKEIDKEIYNLGADNVISIMKSPQSADELNNKLKKSLKKLKEEKEKIIEENNIPADYDKYKYACEICGDTGYTEDGKKCV